MANIIIPLAVIAGLLAVIVGAGVAVGVKMRRVSKDVFGTDDFIKGYNEQKRKLSETPRSVHSMTNIYLPKIHQDFPEFDYELFRLQAQEVVRGYLNAITTGTTATLPDTVTPTLKNYIQEIIENLYANNQKQFFLEPVIHDAQIGRYIKDGATVTVMFNVSVGMIAYVEDADGRLINGDRDNKLQTVYEVSLVYLQDADKMGVYGEGLGLSCPHCGAPVRNLGQKFCEYCGSGVIEVNTRVWKFNSVREQTQRRTAY